MLEVKLTVVPSPEEHRKQSLTWLAAMQKVSDQCSGINVIMFLVICYIINVLIVKKADRQ